MDPNAPAPPTSGKAVASLVLAISSGLFLFSFYFFPLAIPAIVLGYISRSEIAQSGGHLKGAGMARAGLILGYASLASFLLFFFVLAPGFISARQSVDELSAIGVMKTINKAAATYQTAHPEKGYPASLADLGKNAGSYPALVDAMIASGEKADYRFTYIVIDNNGDGVNERYMLNADPIPWTDGRNRFVGITRRHFFSDETGVVRSEPSGMATKGSPALEQGKSTAD